MGECGKLGGEKPWRVYLSPPPAIAELFRPRSGWMGLSYWRIGGLVKIDEAFDDFLTAKKGDGLSPLTIAWYEDMYSAFSAWLVSNDHDGGVYVSPQQINAYKASGQGLLQPATIAGRYRALRAFYNWLEVIDREVDVAASYLGGRAPPTRKTKEPKVPKKTPRAASINDWVILLGSIKLDSWLGQRDHLLVSTLFLCGVRVAEVVNLRIGDYDLANKMLIVRAGKGGDSRLVPLLEPVAKSFLAYMFARPALDSDIVFVGSEGWSGKPRGRLSVTGVRGRLKKLCKLAGIGYINPHAFRHGLARFLLNSKGADMALIQKVLGHKKLTTTSEIYALWDSTGVSTQYNALMADISRIK